MKKVFTIPNIISVIRIVLIPVIVWTYFDVTIAYHYRISGSLLFLSGLSDFVDGYIARKMNQISDLGKILDPIADKLTQGAVVFCLFIIHPNIWPMLVVLIIKELLTLFFATYLLKNGTKPMSAKWWGKISTIFVYLTMFEIVISDIINKVPVMISTLMSFISAVLLLMSMLGYIRYFFVPRQYSKENN